MMKKALFFIGLSGFCGFLEAQRVTDSPVLMVVGDDTVTKAEFCRSYAQNLAEDGQWDKKDVEDYLQMYIDFRLKVAAAEDEGYDTVGMLQREYQYYRTQLAQPYLMDTNVQRALFEEIYSNMHYEVLARRIMLRVPDYMTGDDTLPYYEKLMGIRGKLLEGADFADMVRSYCDEYKLQTRSHWQPKTGHEGEWGYMASMVLEYPLEKACYSLRNGEISLPVRGRFGYYVIQVLDKKPALGKARASHIMLAIDYSDTVPRFGAETENEIWAVYDSLQKGMPFAEAAGKFSDDKYSAVNGGSLGMPFFSYQMVPEFVSVLYGLEEGQYSKPFRSRYGWHIARLDDKSELGSYEDEKKRIAAEVNRNEDRQKIPVHAFQDRLLARHSWSMDEDVLQEVRAFLPDTVSKLYLPEDSMSNPGLFSKTLMYYDGDSSSVWSFMKMARNLLSRQEIVTAVDGWFATMVKEFQRSVALRHEAALLEQTYPDFAAMMEEYRNGILLFAISNEKIWAKAVLDTAGLQAYFDVHRDAYVTSDSLVGKLVSFDASVDASKVSKLVKAACKKKRLGQLPALLEKEFGTAAFRIDSVRYARGENVYADQAAWHPGASKVVEDGNGHAAVLAVEEVIPSRNCGLKEVQGKVVSDYQSYLEDQWVKELRESYKVTVFQDVFDSIFQK